MNSFRKDRLMDRSFVIAEIGVNHVNDMSKARLLIDEAKEAGADAVKFQTFTAENLATDSTPKAPYQELRDHSKDHKTMLSLLQLSKESHLVLVEYCINRKIEFISTAYTLQDAKFLTSIGIKKIKVASADLVDTQMLEYLAGEKVLTILSTGMASLNEILRAIEIFDRNDKSPWIMHCISEYPTPITRANLKRISILKNIYDGIIGFSDHTIGTEAVRVAYGLGARLFEKHLTYDKNAVGPDHAASANLDEFRDYVKAIRDSETVLGTGTFQRTEAENAMAITSRKSLHYNHALEIGKKIDESDLKLIRPGNGFTWDERFLFIGKKIKYGVEFNEQVKVEDVE